MNNFGDQQRMDAS